MPAIAGAQRVRPVCLGPVGPSRAHRHLPSPSALPEPRLLSSGTAQPGPAPCAMAAYKPVVVQACPKLGEKITQDTLYWRGYKVGGSGTTVAVTAPECLFLYYFHAINFFLNTRELVFNLRTRN